jgi:hypothetical protein
VSDTHKLDLRCKEEISRNSHPEAMTSAAT